VFDRIQPDRSKKLKFITTVFNLCIVSEHSKVSFVAVRLTQWSQLVLVRLPLPLRTRPGVCILFGKQSLAVAAVTTGGTLNETKGRSSSSSKPQKVYQQQFSHGLLFSRSTALFLLECSDTFVLILYCCHPLMTERGIEEEEESI
jgi:hypothetical protein